MGARGRRVARGLSWLLFAAAIVLVLVAVWTADLRWAATAGITVLPMLVLAAAGHEGRGSTTPTVRRQP